MSSAAPTRETLVERARELVPVLRQRARKTEERRSLPDETVHDLVTAGFHRVFQPARYGGYEMEWGTQIDLGSEVGRGCGSTAWITSVVLSHAVMLGRFPDEAQRDVWGTSEDVVIATGSARTAGAVDEVDDGYLVTGTWRFASGVDFSDWAIISAPLTGAKEKGPAALMQCLVPKSEFRIHDDWYVSGLRGTGSKNIVIDEPVFVPAHRAMRRDANLGVNPPGSEANPGYLYRMELGPYLGTSILGPILGAAHGALDDYVGVTRTRVGVIMKNKVAESEAVQQRLAESSAEIAASDAVAARMMATFRDRAAAHEPLTPRERVESMRDRAYVARTLVTAVHRLVRMMGATGLGDANPVQRHFRDISAMATQIGVNWDRNAGAYGKWALGVPTGIPQVDRDLDLPERTPSEIE